MSNNERRVFKILGMISISAMFILVATVSGSPVPVSVPVPTTALPGHIDDAVPLAWKETCLKHKGTLSLAHPDDQLAVCFGPEVTKENTTWPMDLLSKAWQYAKATYGPFGLYPRLYVELHGNGNRNETCQFSSFRLKKQKINKLDCGKASSSSASRTWSNLEEMLTGLGNIVFKGATADNVNLEISRGKMSQIIIYDIYRHVLNDTNGKNEDVLQWRLSKEKEAELGRHFLRDWFIPIYERFGEASALQRFYNLTRTHWFSAKNNKFYFSTEEFIHFWSGAARTDLLPLAQSMFSFVNKSELDRARGEYHQDYDATRYTEYFKATDPPGKWRNADPQSGASIKLVLIYCDKHVAIYHHEFTLLPISLLRSISAAWAYVKEAYGPFDFGLLSHQLNQHQQELLYIAIQKGKKRSSAASGFSSITSEMTKNTHTGKYYMDIVEWSTNGSSSSRNNNASTDDNNEDDRSLLLEREIMSQIASIALKLRNDTVSGPAHNITDETVKSLLVYDIYLQLGKTDDARRWRERQSLNDSRSNFPVPGTETDKFQYLSARIYENHHRENSSTPDLKNIYQILTLTTTTTTTTTPLPSSAGDYDTVIDESLPTSTSVTAPNGLVDSNSLQKQIDELKELLNTERNRSNATLQENKNVISQNTLLLELLNGKLSNISGNVQENTENGEKLTEAVEQVNGTAHENRKELLLLTTAKSPDPQQQHQQQHKKLPPPPLHWTEHWEDHKGNLTRVYLDDNVVFYTDSLVVLNSTWPFSPISQAWKYCREIYGPFDPEDPLLYVILHNGERGRSWWSKWTDSVDPDYDNRTVIDIELSALDTWDEETTQKLDILMDNVGIALQTVAKSTGQWPAWELIGWTMSDILVYDMYLGMGRSKDAQRSLEIMLSKSYDNTESPDEKTYLFRDWFYPIYTKYGETEVLSRFFTLLYEYWPRKGRNYVSYLNIGEFVHFWSGAARMEVLPIAIKNFGWSPADNRLLIQAKTDFPNINYTIFQ